MSSWLSSFSGEERVKCITVLSTVETKSRKPTRASAGVIGAGGSCAGGSGVVWGVVEEVLILIRGKFVVTGSGCSSG